MDKKSTNPQVSEFIDTGTFDEMVTLASERALAEGGVVVIAFVSR